MTPKKRKLRILIASETYHPTISGAVVFTDNLMHSLVEAGHEVALFTPSPDRFYHEYRRHGIRFYRFPSLPVPFRVEARWVIQSYTRVAEIFADFKPDIVHLQSPSGVPFAVARAANKHRVPVVATHHFALEFILAYLKMLAFMTPLTQRALVAYLDSFYERANVITCPTATIRQNLREAGLEVPLEVVSNGVEIARFRKAKPWYPPGVPPDVPFILYVGRLDQDKSLPVLLRCLPAVFAKTSAHMVFAGSGNRQAQLKRLSEELNITDRVHFIGRVSPQTEQLPRLMAAATVFANPSTIETQCIAIMEAFAAGLPVVGVTAGAVPELVIPEKTGLLVAPEDSMGMADALIRILSDPIYHAQLRNGALEQVAQHDFPNTVAFFEQLYFDLVDNALNA